MALVVKNPHANVGYARAMLSIPGLGRSPGEGNGNPSQYSCLENSMGRGAWQSTVHRVKKSRTRLSMHAQHILNYVKHLIVPMLELYNKVYSES